MTVYLSELAKCLSHANAPATKTQKSIIVIIIAAPMTQISLLVLSNHGLVHDMLEVCAPTIPSSKASSSIKKSSAFSVASSSQYARYTGLSRRTPARAQATQFVSSEGCNEAVRSSSGKIFCHGNALL